METKTGIVKLSRPYGVIPSHIAPINPKSIESIIVDKQLSRFVVEKYMNNETKLDANIATLPEIVFLFPQIEYSPILIFCPTKAADASPIAKITIPTPPTR